MYKDDRREERKKMERDTLTRAQRNNRAKSENKDHVMSSQMRMRQ